MAQYIWGPYRGHKNLEQYFGGGCLWGRFSCKATYEGTPDPLHQNGIRRMLINLLLHPILSHDKIIPKSAKNVSSSCEGFVYLLDLRDSW